MTRNSAEDLVVLTCTLQDGGVRGGLETVVEKMLRLVPGVEQRPYQLW